MVRVWDPSTFFQVSEYRRARKSPASLELEGLRYRPLSREEARIELSKGRSLLRGFAGATA